MTLNLTQIERAPLEEEMRARFKEAFDTALLDLADHLQKASPRGVSGGLAAGWNVVPAKKRRGVIPEVLGEVVNTAPAAEFRIRGRAPGKMPPIAAVESWAVQKGLNPYAVARSIGKRGTRRWRERKNILGQDPVTLKFNSDSPVYTVFQKQLAEEWDKIKF